MEARVVWVEGRTFMGVSDSGHGVVLGARHNDKAAPGPSPMELLLIGLAGCAAFDVVLILERGREPISQFKIRTDDKETRT